MNKNFRNSSIDFIGDVPWGTHFCQFYQTKEDLLDIIVPYFKAGLENNEFCMWVTSQPLEVEEVKEAFRKVVPDVDINLEIGQLEIIPYTQWYKKDGFFDSDRVLNGWVEKLNQALARGYDGLRLTGNTFWLEKEDWNDFADYEEEVDRVLGNYNIIALCTYSLDKCNATEIIDVVANHQFALIKREGKWEQIESPKRMQAENALRKAYEALKVQSEELQKANEKLIESQERERARSDELAVLLDAVPVAVYIARDLKVLKITGNRLSYEWQQLPLGTNFSKSAPEGKLPETFKLFKDGVEMLPEEMPSQMAAAGIEINDCELDIVSDSGETRHVLGNARPLLDDQGNIRGSISAFIDITERKKVEEALRLSNLYNRSLIEASLDPLVVIGNDGNVNDVNKATEQATGYSRDDLIGTYFAQYLTEPDNAISAFIHVCTHGELRDCALEIKHRDGHITPVLCNASVYRDESGKVIGVFVAARDITESKKAEEVLKQANENLDKLVKERTAELEEAYNSLKGSEERLAEAQKIVHIGNYDWNITTDEEYWSDELYRIFGLDHQFKLNHSNFLNRIYSEDLEYVCHAINEALNGKPYKIDYRIILPDGEVRVIYSQGGVIFDEKNTPIRMRGIVQDITERKRSEEKLRESEEKYRNIVETANEGIWLVDAEFRTTYANKKMVDMLGYRLEEMIGRLAQDFADQECKTLLKQRHEKRRQGISESYNLKIIRKDGTPLWTFVNTRSLVDKNGKFMGCLGMVTDITERKEVEEALRNFEIARNKEIHHRIKNNLQVISSLLDLQADLFKGRENIKDSEVLKAFKQSIDRVLSIALIHEELYKGKNIELLNFPQYIEELVNNLLLTYRLETDVSLDFDLEKNIFLDMDTAIPLGIVINEIVSNSFKYAFSGRDKGEIQIKLHREKNGKCKIEDCKRTTFTLSVSDNGIGIPEDFNIEELDSLGFQLVTTLVDQLDGEFELKRDNGTEFNIRFIIIEDDNRHQRNPNCN